MTSKLNPYLTFKGEAKAAMELYEKVFGGKLDIRTFAEAGMPTSPEQANQIMHAELIAENGMTIMASDVPDIGGFEYSVGTNFSISLSGDNMDELSGYFEKLSDGGSVVEPLVKAPWGDTFGIVKDKFGIMWMVNISTAQH